MTAQQTIDDPSAPSQTPEATAALGKLARYQHRRRVVLAIIVAAMLSGLLFVSTPENAFHARMEQLGAVLILAAILGRTWCTLYIGGRKSSEIVRTGPYSVTRNPLYVFSVIGAAGIGAMSGSAVTALAFAVLTYISFAFVIRVEEAHLESVFGEPFRAYTRDVPRFFPDPRLFVESELLTVRPHFIYRTFRDGLMFALSYPFFEIIENLQESGALPILLHLV